MALHGEKIDGILIEVRRQPNQRVMIGSKQAGAPRQFERREPCPHTPPGTRTIAARATNQIARTSVSSRLLDRPDHASKTKSRNTHTMLAEQRKTEMQPSLRLWLVFGWAVPEVVRLDGETLPAVKSRQRAGKGGVMIPVRGTHCLDTLFLRRPLGERDCQRSKGLAFLPPPIAPTPPRRDTRVSPGARLEHPHPFGALAAFEPASFTLRHMGLARLSEVIPDETL
jgi:hypothetical protein